MADPVYIAAMEGGGTSFVVAVAEVLRAADGNELEILGDRYRILYRAEIGSSHDRPHQTLDECASFFRLHNPGRYDALGVAMFGPLGCDPNKPDTYGTILETTPKEHWRGVDVLSPLVEACSSKGEKLAVKIDTDVNAPAVAEFQSCSNKKNISSLAYVTVGTGVGVGLVVHGKPVHGRMHPEGGHVSVQPLEGDTFGGYSWGAKNPFKGKHTVEGMTSSIALTERLGYNSSDSRNRLADLNDDDHEVWDHAANALANLCVTLALVTSVEKIVLGGGIMNRNKLIDKIRIRTKELLNGYLGDLHETEWITTSEHGGNVGLLGACVLAHQAMTTTTTTTSLQDAKRTAYGVGVKHGILMGLSVAYIGICVWARSGKMTSSNRC